METPRSRRALTPQPVVLLIQSDQSMAGAKHGALQHLVSNLVIALQSMDRGGRLAGHRLSVATFDQSVRPHWFDIDPRDVPLRDVKVSCALWSSGANVRAALNWAGLAITQAEIWLKNNPELIPCVAGDAVRPVCFYLGDGNNGSGSVAIEADRLRNLRFMGCPTRVVCVDFGVGRGDDCLRDIAGSDNLIVKADALLDDQRMWRDWLPDRDQTTIVKSSGDSASDGPLSPPPIPGE